MSRNERYSRQMLLPEIGPEGQKKLSEARVLVIGAGGLGCPALLYLAGAGIGQIGIVDFDRVDISNLHRQILFAAADEGKPKAWAARERLHALNPGITINAYEEELTDRNVAGFFSACDVIIDGTDNFAAKFLINDAAVKLGKPVVYAAIQGFEAQVAVFNHDGKACYRCLHPHPPQGHIMNCAESGVIGALAGIAGTMQAMEAIKLIVAHENFRPLSGKMWRMDARTMEVVTLDIPRRYDCPVCSRPAAQIIPQYSSPVCAANTVAEICCEGEMPENALFIDVREREEWDTGHIREAQHLPLSALQNNPEIFAPFGNGRACVIYCQKGGRSKKAAEILMQAGFTGLYSLKGGYERWREIRKDRVRK